MRHTMIRATAAAAAIFAALGCGGDDGGDPPIVDFGEPTIVVIVNPVVNDVNEADVPDPGIEQGGVDVDVLDGPGSTTDGDGIAVLAPVEAGTRTISFDGLDAAGEVTVDMGSDELRELAVAVDDLGAAKMAEVEYDFAETVVEILPSASLDEVNDALSLSNTIVFFRGGTYTGDVEFTGSNVTLFGEGPSGGLVILDGNVRVSGSENRIRGAIITGTLTIEGSDAALIFSRVDGPADVSGSDAKLIHNDFCDDVTISASGITALGNAGLAPLAADCP